MRIAGTIVVVVAAMFFTFWIGGALFALLHLPDGLIWPLAQVLSLVAAGLAGRAVWTREGGTEGLAGAMLTGALVVGGIAFCLGFFGPMLLTPDANQGPMLGLFITGPLGLLLGAIGGAVRWAWGRGQ